MFEEKQAIRRTLGQSMHGVTDILAVETCSVRFEKIAEIKKWTIEEIFGCKAHVVYPMQPILVLQVEDWDEEFPRVLLKVISGEHVGWMVAEKWMLIDELKIVGPEPMELIKR